MEPMASPTATKLIVKPPGRLQDKVAIVTGSSSGLGRAIALRYAAEGAKVVCADLRPGARMDVAGERAVDTHDSIIQAGGAATFIPCDVGSAAAMEALVAGAVACFGRLDVMVNNAGIAPETGSNALPVHECTEATWDTAMRVNAKSVFLGCKFAVTQMLAQMPLVTSSQDRGWIINLSSIYGLVGCDRGPAYCASKGAVSNLTRQVAIDYSRDGIHCNAICPGHVETAIFAETALPPDDLARMYPFKGAGKYEYPETMVSKRGKIAVY